MYKIVISHMYVHCFILWKFGLKVANVKKEDNLSKVL